MRSGGQSPSPLRRWAATLNDASRQALPGADHGRGVALNRAIDLHKALSGPFVLALMLTFDVFTVPAWIYLALHGSYGVAWWIKDRTLPDRQWQRRVTWPGVLAAWAFLSLYWVAPVILVLGTAGTLNIDGWHPPPAPLLAVAVALYSIGLVLMIGADAQKNLTIALRGRSEGGPGGDADGLITSGFFARTRHPNYLGEMMIYGAFALVANHWIPWLIVTGVWVLFFVPNMLVIDARLSRYPEFREWKQRTGFILPRMWR